MNKKILIGSIIAVVILVLMSFTGVVGYQSAKSSTIAKASPLFSVRTSRAIDKESEDIACDYVGKGEESALSIPKRDDRTVLTQRAIDIVSKMDDKAFKRLVELFYKHIRKRKYEENANVKEILQSIRNNPDRTKNNIVYTPNVDDEPTRDNWFPGCLLLYMLMFVLDYVYALFFLFLTSFGIESMCVSTCISHCYTTDCKL